MLTVYGSHTLLKIPSYLTQFFTENHQNSTRKSLHVSDNMVYSQICHKYIHIMGGKDQTSKEIATCLNSVSPRICCEQAAAGMLRAFPVNFVVLQSNSTHCNVHGSRAATENCMKCNISPWDEPPKWNSSLLDILEYCEFHALAFIMIYWRQEKRVLFVEQIYIILNKMLLTAIKMNRQLHLRQMSRKTTTIVKTWKWSSTV